MKLISGKNAKNEALKIIKKQYSLFKCVIVICEDNILLYSNFLEEIKQTVKSFEIVQLPKHNALNSASIGLINTALSDDVGVIIAIGTDTPLEIFNLIKQKHDVIWYLTNLTIVESSELVKYAVFDFDIIKNVANKSIASLVGLISGLNFYITENVFNNGVFLNNVNKEVLLEIEKHIKVVANTPSAVFKSEVGKKLLFNICLELSKLNFYDNYKNSFVYKLALNIKQLNNYKDLNIGEAILISTILAYKLFFIVLNVNSSFKHVGFSAQKRIENYKKFSKDFKLTNCSNSFKTLNNINITIKNFLNTKQIIKTVSFLYANNFVKTVQIYKNLFYDKGMFLKKFINYMVLSNSLNFLPENENGNTLSTFIRDVGLLNKI